MGESLSAWHHWLPPVLIVCGLALVWRSRNHGAEVFASRNALPGLKNELAEVDTAWAHFPAGPNFATLTKDELGKVKRLILSDPQAPELASYVQNAGVPLGYAVESIREATKAAKNAGADVSWHNCPSLSMLIGNPQTRKAWVRYELVLPTTNHGMRPSLVLRKPEQAAEVEAAERLFNELWKVATPQ